MKQVTVVIGCVVMLCSMVSGKDYYVSQNGDNGNPGSKDKPFKTIQKAADVMAAGDTCYVGEGKYTESVKVTNSGTKEAPIRFAAQAEGKVTINGIYRIDQSWIGYFDYEIWSTSAEKTFQTGTDGRYYSEVYVDGEKMTRVANAKEFKASKQWFMKGTRLVLWPPEGESPAGVAAPYNNPQTLFVEGRLTAGGFTISGADYVMITDFLFADATVTFENCSHCTVGNCSFSSRESK